jgi:hypothetical protein
LEKKKRGHEKEDYMNEGHPKFTLSRLPIVQDEDKSTRKKENVRYRKRNEKTAEQVNKEQVPDITGCVVA